MTNEIVSFEDKKIRRVEYNGEWYFSVEDIVFVLTNSVNTKDYIKKMKKRDEELQKGWGQIVTPLAIETNGGKQKINCANLEGCFRIIQSIPSPKAEPIKQWLAKVGYERIQEIEDPEIAEQRAVEYYKQKGYEENWIKARIQTIFDRKNLTDEWKNRGATEIDYSIFTSIMSEGTFGIKPSEHKKIKGLKRENLRDHMTPVELSLVNLSEVVAREIHKTNNTKGREKLKADVKKAGEIAGKARKNIETETKRPVVSGDNYLQLSNGKIKAIK